MAEAEDGSGMRLMPPSFTFSLDLKKKIRVVFSEGGCHLLQHNIGKVLIFRSEDLGSFETLGRDTHLNCQLIEADRNGHAIQYLNISEATAF
jgi:hypothetical protein